MLAKQELSLQAVECMCLKYCRHRRTYFYDQFLLDIRIHLVMHWCVYWSIWLLYDAHQSRFLAEGYAFAGNIQISILSQVTHVFSNRIELLPLCCLHVRKGTSVDCVGLLHRAASHLRLQIELFLPSLHGFEGLFQFGDLRMLSALTISQLEVTEFLTRLDDSNRSHASPLRWAPTKSDSGSPHLALAFTAIQRLSRLCHSLPQTFHLCQRAWLVQNQKHVRQKIKLYRCKSRTSVIPTAKLPLTLKDTEVPTYSSPFSLPAASNPQSLPLQSLPFPPVPRLPRSMLPLSRSSEVLVVCGWKKIAVQVAAFFFKSSWMSCSSLTVVSKCSTCRYNVHFQIFSLRRLWDLSSNLLWSLNKAFQWHQYVSVAKLCRITSHSSHQLTFCAGSPSVTWRRRASTSSARLVTCKCKTSNIYKF